MRKLILALSMAACSAASIAEPVKLPVDADDKGAVYVAPNVNPTETSAEMHGATVGVEKKDGSGAYIGTDTSTTRPVYSVGGSTAGNVSFTGGVSSDGKANNGVKAGINFKY